MSSPLHAGSSNMHTCLVSVVGFTAHGNTYESSTAGIGKSCLCSRFCYGGVDEYVSDHPGIMALHEFESQVISTDSFIYWGPHTLTHSTKSNNSKEVSVKYEVVEHTIFYHDETSQPFPNLRKLTVPRNYAKKVVSTPESSRKISYYARDAIGFPDKYRCMPYPSNPSRLARGFILAIDVSMKDYQFEYQLTAAESIVFELRKNVIVVAATKRDIASPSSMARLIEWAYKQKLTMIETSAKDDVNVEDVFRVVAARLLSKKVKINDSFLDYAQGSGYRLKFRSQAKREFKNYLKSFVLSSSIEMEKIESLSGYQISIKALGKFVTDEMLASHMLAVRNQELDSCVGTDDPEMRTEMLEDFIEDCPHFGPHKKVLYKLMNSLINPGHAVYANETFVSPLPEEDESPKSPEKYVKLVNQVYDNEKDIVYDRNEEVMIGDGSSTGIDESTTSLQSHSSSSLVMIEEVYDKFENEQKEEQDEVTKLTMLSIKDRASLLKSQLTGDSSVQVSEFLQDCSAEYEVPVLSTSNDDLTDGTATTICQPLPPPPPIPGKPKGYQKWSLAKKEETQSQETVANSPPVKPKGYQKWSLAKKEETQSQETVANSPPVKPKGYQKWSLVKKEETQSQEIVANSPPVKPKGYQKWSLAKKEEPQSHETVANDIKSTNKPEVSPPVKPKGYQKWKLKEEPLLPDSIAHDDGMIISEPQQVPSPPVVPGKPKGYQKWVITKTEASFQQTLPNNEPTKEVSSPAGRPKGYQKWKPPITKETTDMAGASPQLSSPQLPITKPKGYQKWKPIKTEETSTDGSSELLLSEVVVPPSQPSPKPKPKRDNYSPMLPKLREKHRQLSQGNASSSSNESSPIIPPHDIIITAPLAGMTPPSRHRITPSTSPQLPINNITPITVTHSLPVSSLNDISPRPASVNVAATPFPLSPPAETFHPLHSQSLNSISTASHDISPPPPPIPPHTTQMLETVEEGNKKKSSTSPSKRHNYFNTFIKSFKKDKSKSVDEGIPSAPFVRPTVVNMRNRSLPAEPVQLPPMHFIDDYENREEFLTSSFTRPPMPLPPEPVPKRQVHPSASYTDFSEEHPYDEADPLLLNHAWIMNRKLEQQGQKRFDHSTSRTHTLHANLPRRTQSFQVNYRLNTRDPYFDDTVDEEGYQKTDMIEDIRQARKLPTIPPGSLDRRYSFEYDYPNIRGIRSMAAAKFRVPPPRSPHRTLVKEESYVNMDLGGHDDYQNSEVIKAMLDSVSPKRTPPRSNFGSLDDMSIYYNLRERTGLISPPTITATPSPPSVKPKPVITPKPISSSPSVKKRSLTMIDDKKAFEVSDQKVQLQKQEDMIDAETGQKKKKNLTLPPRNILRPGFNANDGYTPIIN